ncbi:translation initiation factor IF-2 [Acidisoma cellulosilytica]|uniref:Translation initiation factor IF-2 n=1 Tax=Acidisoma cellulosilyticum TaxID=2802395 RepID=A0A964E231_9PROT|nr:translation initiation factor IF-2 [Acidisoma cellulosilyticum]MCB8879180.1 translation initiation factor IF-2 [Acidisoma cellulosilyticum]
MSDTKDQDGKARLSLRPAGRLELGRTVDAGSVRQSFSHGRSKVVQVEVRKKRAPGAPPPTSPSPGPSASGGGGRPQGGGRQSPGGAGRALTASELAIRQRVLEDQKRDAAKREAEAREREKIMILSAAEEARRREDEERKAAEEQARLEKEEAGRKAAEEADRRVAEQIERKPAAEEQPVRRPVAASGAQQSSPQPQRQVPNPAGGAPAAARPAQPPRAPAETLRLKPAGRAGEEDEESRPVRRPGGTVLPARKPPVVAPKKGTDDRRRTGKINVQAAIEGDDERVRSIASMRRQRDRERRQAELERLRTDQVKVVRDVVLPEMITVQELANRMAARAGEVVKALMKMGVMATITQSIDADTAELIVQEFGHRVKRVSESDVEIGLEGEVDDEEDLMVRPPVVTIMGHVDHGKTSLLDALRHTTVAAGEAGGITQHIGAYQITTARGEKITFIDTPGHAAFTAMRSRGASVTDIVILVVAADDGVMPQTIEAISHAKAANVPIIVAINKMDKPGANPERVRNELLQHEIVVESLGGDTQEIHVSALKRTGLDKLEDAILVQAEVLDLKANPTRDAEGVVIESRLDRGRGPVATVLVQKGTLWTGDILVAGAEYGRVRALIDWNGANVKTAGPSMPVEVLGLSAVPAAGETFTVVDDEPRAREVAEFRQRKLRDKAAAGQIAGRGTLDQMLARIQAGVQKEVGVVIKADVQGSSEAIQATVLKLANEEVKVRVLLAGVGQISESDIQLAKASSAVIVAFNVRATVQARELAQRENVDIRYYSIIYDVADDVEKLVRGRMAPKVRENFLGYAEIRKVFDITKSGKVAGCMVTEGVVRRGAGVRLLRDNVVIHTGDLSQLKRFKDDVKEVARSYECGLSFAGFQDLREGDMVECYERELVPA